MHSAVPAAAPKVGVPQHWCPQKDNAELVPVESGGPEWLEVEGLVLQSMPRCQLVKVERVQNLVLWTRYTAQRDTIRLVNGEKDVNEQRWVLSDCH
jgi:hypothetical protein